MILYKCNSQINPLKKSNLFCRMKNMKLELHLFLHQELHHPLSPIHTQERWAFLSVAPREEELPPTPTPNPSTLSPSTTTHPTRCSLPLILPIPLPHRLYTTPITIPMPTLCAITPILLWASPISVPLSSNSRRRRHEWRRRPVVSKSRRKL